MLYKNPLYQNPHPRLKALWSHCVPRSGRCMETRRKGIGDFFPGEPCRPSSDRSVNHRFSRMSRPGRRCSSLLPSSILGRGLRPRPAASVLLFHFPSLHFFPALHLLRDGADRRRMDPLFLPVVFVIAPPSCLETEMAIPFSTRASTEGQ